VNPIRRRRLGRATGFAPAQPAFLQLWVAADFGTYTDTALTSPVSTDGTAVGGWRDQSGKGNHATQATGARQPLLKTAVQNGKPSVLFAVANTQWLGVDSLAAAFTGSSLPITVMAVVKPVSVGSGQVFLGFGAAGTTPTYFFSINSGVVWGCGKTADAGGTTTVTGGTPNTSPHIVTWIGPGTTMEINVDGTQVAAPTAQNRAPTTLTTGAIGAVNSNGAASTFLNGNLFELFAWSVALTGAEQQFMRQAMATKYGIVST
jgi:hypothetical protein